MNWLRVCTLALTVSAALAAASAHAQQGATDATVDRGRLEQRLVAVETLLEKSSAARQVETSGDAAARQKRARAREIYREARAAFDAGQYARASALLPEASAQMFEAVRLAAPEQVTAPKARADYQARLNSVNALHAAYQRVAAEKPGAAGVAETNRNIENLIREAERLAGEGKVDAGRATLDRAYLLTRAAVSSLRSGDTLVRNELTDRQQTFVDKASQLRTQADAAAAGADHAMAVKLLEESTRELIRAIRSAGVFIPG